jgi:hypothetical protein
VILESLLVCPPIERDLASPLLFHFHIHALHAVVSVVDRDLGPSGEAEDGTSLDVISLTWASRVTQHGQINRM